MIICLLSIINQELLNIIAFVYIYSNLQEDSLSNIDWRMLLKDDESQSICLIVIRNKSDVVFFFGLINITGAKKTFLTYIDKYHEQE